MEFIQIDEETLMAKKRIGKKMRKSEEAQVNG
jgi:hypothetical protein